MSAPRTYECLSCRLRGSIPDATKYGRRQFHASTAAKARQKPKNTRGKPAYPNVKAVDMGLVEARVDQLASGLRPYTPREKQLLALKYTPEQIEAIEEGEKAIDPRDIVKQGRPRQDYMRLKYRDDLSKISPLIDHPVKAPDADIDPEIRARTDDEMLEAFAKWHDTSYTKHAEWEARRESGEPMPQELVKSLSDKIRNPSTTPEERRKAVIELDELDEGIDPMAGFERMAGDPSTFMHSPKGTLDSQQDHLAPEIPKMNTPGLQFDTEEVDPRMERLLKQTGLDEDEVKRLRVKNLVYHRVVNQTRLGKIQSLYFLTIAGNQQGMLGVGEGKAAEEEDGRRQAMMAAIRNMKPIPRYEGRTIFGEVEGKVGASVVKLSARPPGFGNRCQHLIFEVARAAGISDLAAKTPRSRNKMNVVKATWEALMSQRLPEDVARARGRKLVDVRKVYYGGAVN
ncbi:hypothetical protein MBLNU230_g3034t1 [Neophaeotheca triangularis]